MISEDAAHHRAALAYEHARAQGVIPAAAMREALEAWDRLRKGKRSRYYPERSPEMHEAAVAVIESVAKFHGMTANALRGPCRLAHVLRVRDEAVYLVRAMLPTVVSYPALGRWFRRDHATLVVGMRRFERRLAADELLAVRMRRIVEATEAARVGVAVQAEGGAA